MSYYLLTGFLLGLTAGISPGPLQTLLISETMLHNKRAGMSVAIAPLISDLPIILTTIFIIQSLSGKHTVMGCIALSGAVYLLFLAYGSFRFKAVQIEIQHQAVKSLRKGVVANFLNPHPYLFWMTVGAPSLINAIKLSSIAPAFFIIGFYSTLIGSLIMTAFIVDRSKAFIKQHIYIYIIRGLGVALVILAVLFCREAINHFTG